MKKQFCLVAILSTFFCMTNHAFGSDDNQIHLADLDFAAPAVYGDPLNTNSRVGSITYDMSTNTFRGLYANGNWSSIASGALAVPTVQRLTSGTSYTTPAGVLYLKVTVVGGGGGGQGRTGNGGNGGDSTFGSSITAAGGTGCSGSTPTAGGAPTVNSPAIALVSVNGGDGSAGLQLVGANGNNGGTNPMGGAGVGGLANGGTGSAGKANTGAGGGGAAGNSSVAYGSGGAGAYIEAIIPSPSSTYSYSIGAAGAAGATAGSAGGSGIIIVEEFYQ